MRNSINFKESFNQLWINMLATAT